MYELIILALGNSTAVKVRTLTKKSRKIIAMSPALGLVTQVMTRCIFSVLSLKGEWNQIININYHNDCIRELVFWKLNIFDPKPASLLEKPLILIFLLMQVIPGQLDLYKTQHLSCISLGQKSKLSRVRLGEN